jgi:hypothetical protein
MFFVIPLIEVSPFYDGPTLDNGNVTKEFIEEMIECFEDQDLIHKKYAYQVSNLHFCCVFIMISFCYYLKYFLVIRLF